MLAIEFTAPKTITAIDLDHAGSPGPGMALVRTRQMGICGTDISCYLGKFPFFDYPRTPGHELGLEVLAVGRGVTHIKPGDKCSLEPYVDDPRTRTSQRGHSNCCPHVQVIGVHTSGGLRKADWMVPGPKTTSRKQPVLRPTRPGRKPWPSATMPSNGPIPSRGEPCSS